MIAVNVMAVYLCSEAIHCSSSIGSLGDLLLQDVIDW